MVRKRKGEADREEERASRIERSCGAEQKEGGEAEWKGQEDVG